MQITRREALKSVAAASALRLHGKPTESQPTAFRLQADDRREIGRSAVASQACRARQAIRDGVVGQGGGQGQVPR